MRALPWVDICQCPQRTGSCIRCIFRTVLQPPQCTQNQHENRQGVDLVLHLSCLGQVWSVTKPALPWKLEPEILAVDFYSCECWTKIRDVESGIHARVRPIVIVKETQLSSKVEQCQLPGGSNYGSSLLGLCFSAINFLAMFLLFWSFVSLLVFWLAVLVRLVSFSAPFAISCVCSCEHSFKFLFKSLHGWTDIVASILSICGPEPIQHC